MEWKNRSDQRKRISRNRLLKGESSCKDTEQLRVRKENVRCLCRFDKDGCKQTVIW